MIHDCRNRTTGIAGETWRRPTERERALRQLAELRRAACRFLIERGRRARRSDVDDLLLTFWWRLPDGVHELLDGVVRSQRRRGSATRQNGR